MVVREALYNDVPQLLDIYNDAILNTTSVYSYQPHTLAMRQQWFQERQQHAYPVFVCEAEGRIAGFSSYGAFRNWPAYQYTVENSVYVHPKHRGKGVGSLLLQPLIAVAKQKKVHAMVAGIDALNSPSLALHKKFGFVQVAHFKQVGFKFGAWLDLIFLELLFETPIHPAENESQTLSTKQ